MGIDMRPWDYRWDAQTIARQLATGRVLLATTLCVAPVGSVRALGVDTATARRVSWLTRMLAVRDGLLGVGAIAASRRAGAAPWLLCGAVADAADAVVLAAAIRQHRLGGRATVVLPPAAAVAALAGAVTAFRLRRAT